MTEIEINAGGRYVKIQQDGRDAETLLPLAEQAWKATERAKHESDGPAFGFQAERRDSRPAQPSGMPWAPGPYPVQGMEIVSTAMIPPPLSAPPPPPPEPSAPHTRRNP